MKKTLSALVLGAVSMGSVSTASAANDFPVELFEAVEETVTLTIEADEYMTDAEKDFVIEAFDFFAEGTSIFSGEVETLFDKFLAIEEIELTTEEEQMLAKMFDIYRNEKSFIQRAVWAGYWSEAEYLSEDEIAAMKPLVSVLSSHYLEFDITEQPRDIETLMEEIEEEAIALEEKYAYLAEDPAFETMAIKVFMGSMGSGFYFSDIEDVLFPTFTEYDEEMYYIDDSEESIDLEEVMEVMEDNDFWRDNEFQWEDEDDLYFDWDGGTNREIHPDYSGASTSNGTTSSSDQSVTQQASVMTVEEYRNYRGTRIDSDRIVYPKTNDRGYIVK